MLEAALACARDLRERHIESLKALLRIPSISTLLEHQADVQRAAEWLADYLREIGMKNVEIIPTAGHPSVYAEWFAERAGPDKPTLLAYGHYDVQPVDPFEEWRTPPFEPTILGDDLFCRGASDDKGQFFAILAAAECYLKSSGRLPINLKVILEGEEEITSMHFGEVLSWHRDRLAADAVLIADQPMFAPQMPILMYGLRGIAYMQVEVRGPANDLHSGTFGGGVDNPFNVLVRLLAALQDPATHRILIPGFYDRVRPIGAQERELWKNNPVNDTVAQYLTGVPQLAGEEGYTTAERVSVRPTLDIHGIGGGFTGEGGKTVIPSRAVAKVSMRLVPDQDPNEIAQAFESYLHSIAPPTVKLQVSALGKAPPVLVDYTSPAVRAAAHAYEQGFGFPPVYMRGGGTLPIAHDLQNMLGAPVVMIGFGLPDDNDHAPNEKLHVPNFYHGIETVIHYLADLTGL